MFHNRRVPPLLSTSVRFPPLLLLSSAFRILLCTFQVHPATDLLIVAEFSDVLLSGWGCLGFPSASASDFHNEGEIQHLTIKIIIRQSFSI